MVYVVISNMGIIEGIVGLLIIFWVVGLLFHIAGGLIHILLVIALILIIIRAVQGSRRS